MRLAAALAVGLVAGVLAMRVQAYQVSGGKFDHNAITYSCGSPLLADAVRMWADVSALEDGGCSDNPDIVLHIPVRWEYDANAIGVAAYTATNFPDLPMIIKQCTIAVRRDVAGYIGVYVHEVGHCLGSAHSEQADAAMAPYCCNPISADDVAMVVSIYGPPVLRETLTPASYRLRVPMIGSD